MARRYEFYVWVAITICAHSWDSSCHERYSSRDILVTRDIRRKVSQKCTGHICGTPIWLENSVNIWNLLWLSRRVIICNEQTGIYLSTFPDALTFEKAQNHAWDKYIFFDKLDRRLMTRTAITQKFKMHWFLNEARVWALQLQTYINLPSLMPVEDKKMRGPLENDDDMWKRSIIAIEWTSARAC